MRRPFPIAAAAVLLSGALAATAHAQAPPLLHEPLALDPALIVEMDALVIPPAGDRPLTTAGLPGHRHPGGTYVYVVEGEVRSRLGEGEEHLFHAGEAWSETPNQAHYLVNASRAAPARLLVVFVAPAASKSLTEPLHPPGH